MTNEEFYQRCELINADACSACAPYPGRAIETNAEHRCLKCGRLVRSSDTVSADAKKPKHTVGVLPQVLLDSIGEYGLARTDGVSELERQHRWELLIAAVKEYAQREVDAAWAWTDVPKPMRSPEEVRAELERQGNLKHPDPMHVYALGYIHALKWVLREE